MNRLETLEKLFHCTLTAFENAAEGVTYQGEPGSWLAQSDTEAIHDLLDELELDEEEV